MFPVCGFLIRPTLMACREEDPKNWALLELGIHLGNLLPYWTVGSRMYADHTHRWAFCRALWEDLDLVQTSSGYILLDMWGVGLCKWTEWDIAKGQRLFSLASFHLSSEWIIMDLDIINKFLIELSATPLWWWPPTQLCLIDCLLPCRPLVNFLEVYIPLSME